jgi:hypothetical protein
LQATELQHDKEQAEDDRSSRDEEVLSLVSPAHRASRDEVDEIEKGTHGVWGAAPVENEGQ